MTPADRALYAEIGKRVKAHRLSAGMTQAQLAKRAFIARSSLANVEVGSHVLPLHRIAQLAAIFRIPVSHLLPDAFFEDPQPGARPGGGTR